MKSIDIKAIQDLNYQCLSVINQVAKQNDIKYFLAYGTLLGAIRHEGSIPWDPDIDILVPWKDYNPLCKALSEKQDSHKKIHQPGLTRDYGFLFARYGYKDLPQSLFHVDIFPLIGAPEDLNEQKRFTRNLRLLSALYYVKKNSITYPVSIYKKAMMPFLKLVLLPISADKIYRIALDCFQKYDAMKTGFYANACGGYGMKEVMPVGFFEKVAEMRYESEKFIVPAAYDEILHHFYGNYRCYPSKEIQQKGLGLTAVVPDEYAAMG